MTVHHLPEFPLHLHIFSPDRLVLWGGRLVPLKGLQNEEYKVKNAKFTLGVFILQFLFFTLHFAIRTAAEPADRGGRATRTFSVASNGTLEEHPF